MSSTIVIQTPAYGDTVTARCDICPQGDDCPPILVNVVFPNDRE